MSPQADYVVSNGTGAAVRSDINGQLAAIVSNNSGASAPATTYAYMLWADTSTNLLKLRNGANSAWITVGDLTAANLGLAALASPTFTGTVTIPTATISTGAGIPLGSAASPAIYFTGDTNTGIYSPGADQFAITTGGSGRVFVDSSGRVGLGTSSFNTGLLLQTAGGTSNGIGFLTSGTASVVWRLVQQGANDGSAGIMHGSSSARDFYIKSDGGGTANLLVDGKLGIGTPTPNALISLKKAAPGVLINTDDGTVVTYIADTTGSVLTYGTYNSYPVAFKTGDTERGRWDTSGRFLVGTSSAPGAGNGQYGKLIVQGYTGDNAAQAYVSLQRGEVATSITANEEIAQIGFNSSDGYPFAAITANADATVGAGDYPGRLVFSTTPDGSATPVERLRIHSGGCVSLANGLVVGSTGAVGSEVNFGVAVMSSGAGNSALKYSTVTGKVTYDTSSRLVKENIVDCPYGIDALKQLQPRKYFRTDDQRDEIGFVADELVNVLPEFVPIGPKSIITKNEDDTEDVPLGVNYEKLTAVLTKALQEAIAEISSLKDRVAALESA